MVLSLPKGKGELCAPARPSELGRKNGKRSGRSVRRWVKVPTLKVAISVNIQRWTRPRKDYIVTKNLNLYMKLTIAGSKIIIELDTKPLDGCRICIYFVAKLL